MICDVDGGRREGCSSPLDQVNVSGTLLLIFRGTAARGSLLVIHLATVFALCSVMPYSKLAHCVYRYAALAQDRLEAGRGLCSC